MFSYFSNVISVFPGDAKDPDYWNSPTPPDATNPDWMRRLPDSKYFSDISVPGTHDTMARKGGPAYWCQSLSLMTQLNLGIRFLDIRCRAYGSDLPIHHGNKYQGCTFYRVLTDTTNFLDDNPSEIIFMRVKQEYSSEPDSTFDRLVRNHIALYSKERFWLTGQVGTIGEARGKVVLLRNFYTYKPPYGIPYNTLYIADDYYQPSYTTKFNGVKKNLAKAQSESSSKMFLTFNSDCFIAPRDMARTLNTKLHDYVRGRRGRMGMIAMDYPGPGIVEDIIDSNF